VRVELSPLGKPKGGDPTCSAHTRWDGKQCAWLDPASPTSCPPGTVYAQQACIPASGTCPAGFHMEAGQGCVPSGAPAAPCERGYHHEGAGCAPDAAAPGAMVRVPGATFTMGSERVSSASPVHYVTVKTFDIDIAEVTVAEYKACVDTGKCLPPLASSGCNWGQSGREKHPINCISWPQASTYCAWAGKRLPGEAEWEFAAVGQTGWEYPWGNEQADDKHRCNASISCPVGSFPAGKSRFGLLDMTGNVREWMADAWCGYGPDAKCDTARRVIRNGFPAAQRDPADPAQQNVGIGFRCAKDP
jgi:formylglycine-generating enzyme required for sulfatase activity